MLITTYFPFCKRNNIYNVGMQLLKKYTFVGCYNISYGCVHTVTAMHNGPHIGIPYPLHTDFNPCNFLTGSNPSMNKGDW